MFLTAKSFQPLSMNGMNLLFQNIRELLGPAMTDGVVPIELIDRGDSSRSATNILLHAALQRKDIIKDIRLS